MTQSENTVARVFKYIGYALTGVGALLSIIMGAVSESFSLAIGGIIGSIISGSVFIGLSEIIALLEKSVNNQKFIIDSLKEYPERQNHTLKKQEINSAKKTASTSYQKPAHLFRCENCGLMITTYPCDGCGHGKTV